MYRLALLTCSFGLLGSLLTSTQASAQEIKNFRGIAAGIYAGGNPIDGDSGTADFQQLVNLGVKIDIDLQGTDVTEAPNVLTRVYNQLHEKGESAEMIETERALAESAQMNFINLPINSNNPVSAEEELRINQVLSLLQQATPDAPVFVHCEHGADRTGLIIALYRVLYQGVSIDEANDQWTKYGHSSLARKFTGELDRYFCKRVSAKGPSRACADFE